MDLDWKNNNEFATCSEDRTILLWKIGKNEPTKRFIGHKDEISTIKWDPAVSLLASCSEDKTAMVWAA
jgi:transducin (beta)-like 1